MSEIDDDRRVLFIGESGAIERVMRLRRTMHALIVIDEADELRSERVLDVAKALRESVRLPLVQRVAMVPDEVFDALRPVYYAPPIAQPLPPPSKCRVGKTRRHAAGGFPGRPPGAWNPARWRSR